jgi:GNAT superfamily N-acetyltransferase
MNTAPDILIRLARTPEILDLRWRMLRAGLPPDSANFDGDAEPTTHHFVAEQDGKVIGCVTILRRPWEGRPAWQLRGMAVEPFVQSRGIGGRLLQAVETMIRQKSYTLRLWCNARSPATRFYEKNGWTIVGEEFEIPTAGPHFKMTKLLQDS